MNLIDQKLLFHHHGWIIEYWHDKIVPEDQSVFKPVIRHDNSKISVSTPEEEDDEERIVDHHDRKARRVGGGYRY